jgi:hypothetical protein
VRVTLLDAARDPAHADRVSARLGAAGHEVRLHRLRDTAFAPCQGCFRCWVDTPGACRATDAGNDVARDLVRSDRLFWVVEPRFGCWDGVAKAALDRSLSVLSPFFRVVHGETHHRPRYGHYPDWCVLALGVKDRGEQGAFDHLVGRNVLNLQGSEARVFHLPARPPPEALDDAVDRGLASSGVHAPDAPPGAFVVPPDPGAWPADRPRRAVLWVCSAKKDGTSTSEALGAYLLDALAQRGWTTEREQLRRRVRPGGRVREALLDGLTGADLLVLASPVYIDALPALAVTALGALADRISAGDRTARPAIVPLVQCGFPELSHTTLAVSTAYRASRAAGLRWAGHLALGEGGVIDGAPLPPGGAGRGPLGEVAGRLEHAAEVLDAQACVPLAVSRDFSRPLVPAALYRTAGQAGWILRALRHGAALRLWDRPLRPGPGARVRADAGTNRWRWARRETDGSLTDRPSPGVTPGPAASPIRPLPAPTP